MERKIGEIFTYGNKTYQVVKVGIGIGCKGCAFETSGCSTYKFFLGHCFYIFRRDNTRVIFKLINNNMEIKNNQLTIEIPEGMEIDLKNSACHWLRTILGDCGSTTRKDYEEVE